MQMDDDHLVRQRNLVSNKPLTPPDNQEKTAEYLPENGNDNRSSSNSSNSSSNSGLSLENVCWLLASILTIYYSDIFNVMMHDSRIDRLWLNMGLVLISANLLIAFYVIVWLSYVKKLNFTAINKEYFAFIATATAAFLAGSLILACSLWSVYSFLALPILFTIFMGFIVIVINLPSWL